MQIESQQQDLQQRLMAYEQAHPELVTPEMRRYWQQWLNRHFNDLEQSTAKPPGENLSTSRSEQHVLRAYLADRYLQGQGIEIGALHNPLPVPDKAQVKYLDRMPNTLLRLHYFELRQHTLVDVDILDDGEKLDTQPSDSLDFLIANHFLEHCENPLQAIEHHFRVLKPGGILYYTLPDKRFTFDNPREITSFEHLLRDYQQGPESSRIAHYQDWSLHVSHKHGNEHEAWWRLLEIVDYSIHFHVWTQQEAMTLLIRGGTFLKIKFEFEAFFRNQNENIFILKKETL